MPIRIAPTPLGVLACLAVGMAGCSGTGRTTPAGVPPRAPSAPAAPAARSGTAAELEALYLARADSARMRYTEADARFVSDMIVHHAQALVMAGWAPGHGAQPSIRTLCARIVNAQRDEIARMQQWLAERGRPVPEVVPMDGHAMAHGGTVHDMPGMATPDQLAELDAARGADFDRLFLRFMIQHHRGAVVMTNQLLATEGAAQEPQLFKLAADIHADQLTEIARMERMLASLP